MNSKSWTLVAFILVALVQLFVPAKMIWDKEAVIQRGVLYKFKTAPVDPTDPFRGKYITLSYEENRASVENENDWSSGDKIYVLLKTDQEGYAKIRAVMKEKPIDNQNFIVAKVSYVSSNGDNYLSIDYPFDRFYMEESKAFAAEQLYREVQRDTTKLTYASVSIQNGSAVLNDVLINGISIAEMVEGHQ